MSSSLLLLLGFLVLTTLVSAQNGFAINKIDIPHGDNGTSTVKAGSVFLSFVNATVASGFVSSAHYGSFELIADDKISTSVVDIICINQDLFVFSCGYIFPASLPAGQYHFRVNITNDNNNSALSDPFQVTSASFDCLIPPVRKNVTSTDDPNYRSLVITGPHAGFVTRLNGWVDVDWSYVDVRNKGHAGISDLQFDLVSEKTGQAFGARKANSDSLFVSQMTFDFKGMGVSVGAWRARANYSNVVENGGQVVSALSDVFYIQGTDGTKFCDGLGKGSGNVGSTGHNGGLSTFGMLWERQVVKDLLLSSFLALLFWLY